MIIIITITGYFVKLVLNNQFYPISQGTGFYEKCGKKDVVFDFVTVLSSKKKKFVI